MIRGEKILITGGAGFIGSCVAERLCEHNDIALLDIDFSGPFRYSSLPDHERISLIDADVRDADAVESAVAGCSILLHFAAILGVRKVINNARDTIDTTILGTRNVLEAASRTSGIKRLVNISTSEVYGNALNANEGMPASVGTMNDARLSYASAKLMAEHQVWAYHRDFDLPVVNFRPFNIYGPRRTASHAVGVFILKALADAPVTLHGDGSQLRSWCYIDDFCDAMVACIEKDEAVGEDFNIGNAVTAVTIYDLAQRIIRLANSKSALQTTPYTYTDIGVRASNSSKAHERLGYEPKIDLEAGLTSTIDWYRKNKKDFEHWI